MRCVMCHRPLNASAVPGLAIGPKCAKDRGLMPAPAARVRLFTQVRRTNHQDDLQLDWITLLAHTAAQLQADHAGHPQP